MADLNVGGDLVLEICELPLASSSMYKIRPRAINASSAMLFFGILASRLFVIDNLNQRIALASHGEGAEFPMRVRLSLDGNSMLVDVR